MRRLFWAVFVPAIGYQLLAAVAAVRYRVRSRHTRFGHPKPGISVLKPVRGVDSHTYEAFASQAAQRYPRFELLFGVADTEDPAVGEIERLQADFPAVKVRLVLTTTRAGNRKVGQLIDLAKEACYPVWVVNDGDIKVGPDYLSEIAEGLADPEVGVVTCPYRAVGHSAAAEWEAFGVSADFMPSVLVAGLVGVRDFALGATLAFRAAEWQHAGGFEAIRDHLADDYQVGNRVAALGKRSHLSGYVVETSLGDGSWTDIWRHQVRWARTIRLCKPLSHLTLPITHAGFWIAALAASGLWAPAALLYVVRCLSAGLGRWAITPGAVRSNILLAPLWDVYAFAVWLTSYFGTEVRWRDRVLHLRRDGTIVS